MGLIVIPRVGGNLMKYDRLSMYLDWFLVFVCSFLLIYHSAIKKHLVTFCKSLRFDAL